MFLLKMSVFLELIFTLPSLIYKNEMFILFISSLDDIYVEQHDWEIDFSLVYSCLKL